MKNNIKLHISLPSSSWNEVFTSDYRYDFTPRRDRLLVYDKKTNKSIRDYPAQYVTVRKIEDGKK